MTAPRRTWLRVRLVDVRNPLWWVAVAAMATGGVIMVMALAPAAALTPTALVPAALAVGGLGALWWWFMHATALHTKAHTSGKVMAVFWGATAATGIYALMPNTALLSLLGTWGAPDVAVRWGAALVAPLTEEFGKGLGVVVVLLLARQWAQTPLQGAVVGGLVGLGFELAELVLYVLNVNVLTLGLEPVGTSIAVIAMRAVIWGLFNHMLLTALVGAGIAVLWPARGRRRPGLAAVYIAAGVALHAWWNAQVGPWWLTFVWATVFPAGFYMLVKMWRRDEQRWFREVMAGGVSRGVVPQAYVDALGKSRRERRRHHRDVVQTYGYGALGYQRHLEALLIDLADAVAAGDEADAERYRAALQYQLSPATTAT